MKREIRPRPLREEVDALVEAIDRLLPPEKPMFEIVGVVIYDWEAE